jgi:hypothetical protein
LEPVSFDLRWTKPLTLPALEAAEVRTFFIALETCAIVRIEELLLLPLIC